MEWIEVKKDTTVRLEQTQSIRNNETGEIREMLDE